MKLVYENTDFELLNEIATVYNGNNNDNVYLCVNPGEGRIGDPYFKYYNNKSYTAADKVARIKFFEPKYLIHKDKKRPWDLKSKEKKYLINILRRESDYYDNATNWDGAKFEWNREALHLPIKISRYLNGEYDKKYSNNPSYLPSTLKMPDYNNL